MNLNTALQHIEHISDKAVQASWERWDSLAKPLRSLGKLEQVIAQIAGIQRTENISINKKGLIVMCADNGVVTEGVTQTGQEVTAQVAENLAKENRAVTAILCKKAGADIFPIDIGINGSTTIENYKVAYGTKNIYREPAMSSDDAIKAIEIGINLAISKVKDGYKLLSIGEMGIGNTTTSSAIAAVLLKLPVEQITGKGAGLSDEGLRRKVEVIKHAINLHNPNPNDPIDVLAKLGGLDIAGMIGVCIGGSVAHVPVVIDGIIANVAALVATRICPTVREYLIASHSSKEPAAAKLMVELDMEPFLNCEMSLGEGSGAVMLFPILDLAVEIYYNMAHFDNVKFGPYVFMDDKH